MTCEWEKDRVVLTKEGRIEMADETVYMGSILDSERSGFGVQRYINGITYEGNWVCDMRDGYGLIKFDGDCFFEGQFDHDRTSGSGALVLPNRMESEQTIAIEIFDKKPFFGRVDYNLETFIEYTITSKDIVWLAKPKQYMCKLFPNEWRSF
jgi:hypothetical protein